MRKKRKKARVGSGRGEEHVDRIREVARIQKTNPSAPRARPPRSRAFAAEAELWEAQASARVSSGQSRQDRAAGGARAGSDDAARPRPAR